MHKSDGVVGRKTWTSAWTANELPLLVRLRVIFPPNDRRRWPNIVASPRRERPGGV